MLRARCWLASLLSTLCLAASAIAQDVEVAPAVQIPILVKVLSFDRGQRGARELSVGVVYQSGNRASSFIRDEVVRALGAQGVRVVSIDLDHDRLSDVLAEADLRAIYVTPLRATDIGTVAAAARDARVTSLTGVPSYVSNGLAVGVGNRGGRPRILINLEASRREGADLGAELLKLAEIVR